MASTFLSLTDEQLLARLKNVGDVAIGTWHNPETGRHEAGLRRQATGDLMALSSHDDLAAAERAADELEERLERLARTRAGFEAHSRPNKAGKVQGKRRN